MLVRMHTRAHASVSVFMNPLNVGRKEGKKEISRCIRREKGGGPTGLGVRPESPQ